MPGVLRILAHSDWKAAGLGELTDRASHAVRRRTAHERSAPPGVRLGQGAACRRCSCSGNRGNPRSRAGRRRSGRRRLRTASRPPPMLLGRWTKTRPWFTSASAAILSSKSRRGIRRRPKPRSPRRTGLSRWNCRPTGLPEVLWSRVRICAISTANATPSTLPPRRLTISALARGLRSVRAGAQDPGDRSRRRRRLWLEGPLCGRGLDRLPGPRAF